MKTIKLITGNSAIVFGLGPAGLCLVRLLHNAGFYVIGIGRDDDIGRYSSSLDRLLISTDIEQILTFLKEIKSNCESLPFCWIASDQYLNAIVNSWEDFKGLMDFSTCDIELLRLMSDKESAQVECARVGMSVPERVMLKASLDKLGLPLPLAIKPRVKQPVGASDPVGKIRIVRTREEYEQLIDSLGVNIDSYVCEPYIDGDNWNEIGYGGYARSGEILADVAVRQFRQYPQGVACAACEVENEALVEEARSQGLLLIKNWNYSGFFQFDMKVDSAGRLLVMDANLRPWGSVDVLVRKYPDLDKTITSSKRPEALGVPIYWHSPLKEILSFSNRENVWYRPVHRKEKRVLDLYAKGDPMPFIAQLYVGGKKLKDKLGQGLMREKRNLGLTRVAVIGYFALSRDAEGDKKDFGGQTAKCRTLKAWLDGIDDIEAAYVDTYRWKKNPFKLLARSLCAARESDVVILALSENGLRMMLPLFLKLKHVYGFRLAYDVIGGWIAERCSTDLRLLNQLQRLDAIFAETVSMTDDLCAFGLTNVTYVPNAKSLQILEEPYTIECGTRPIPICTFSRVCEVKGITESIETVASINADFGEVAYQLDIFGPIDPEYQAEFDELLLAHQDCVNYKGSVESSSSVEILKQYYLLLFMPKRYQGEGFPGTIVDAFASGVPVVTSNWRNAQSIVEDGKTGFIYDFNDPNGAIKTLKKCLSETNDLIKMRSQCLLESRKYRPNEANAPIGLFIRDTESMRNISSFEPEGCHE